MPTQEKDREGAKISTLTTVEKTSPSELPVEKETCRIFISRKTSDAHILGRDTGSRDKLLSLANERLTFFDAADIEMGQDWRQSIYGEIKNADILLLVLTRPAQNDYDWLLYEAGLFDQLAGSKKLVCIYPEGTKAPDQLSDKQGVEATEDNIRGLLESIFTDEKFTNTISPLNATAPKAFGSVLNEIASEVAADINGLPGNKFKLSYVNPFIRLHLPANADSLTSEILVESNPRTLRSLFQLQEEPLENEREFWSWGELQEQVDLGNSDQGKFNLQWMHETESIIGTFLVGKAGDHQIRSRFIAKDKNIWRPEIEIRRDFDNGKKTVDITFSPQKQEQWLNKAKAPIALGANLNLAVRVRHELLDYFMPRLVRWEDGDEENFAKLEEQIETIESEGFFIGWQTQDVMIEVFDPDDSAKVAELAKDFGQNIYQNLHDGVKARKVKETLDALKLWRVNNAKFLSIGMPRYLSALELGKWSKEDSGGSAD